MPQEGIFGVKSPSNPKSKYILSYKVKKKNLFLKDFLKKIKILKKKLKFLDRPKILKNTF